MFLLAAIILISVLGMTAMFAGTVAAQDSSVVDVDSSDLAGSGTTDDPYVLTNASELQAMEDDLSASYTLGNSIDASGTANWNNGSGFDPVGDSSTFTGTLSGQGYSVTGLTINRPDVKNVGLFGKSSGDITDISIYTAEINGNSNVGVLIGKNAGGVVSNISTSGTVTGSARIGGVIGVNADGTITKSSASTTVTGRDYNISIGGLAGTNQAIITNSSTTGNVTGEDQIGGLVGFNYRTVSNSYATGSVTSSGTEVGGLVGGNWRTVTDSYATGSVIGSGDDVGGLVGYNDPDRHPEIRESYWDTQATGQSRSAGAGEGLTTAQMTGEAARGNMTGLAFDETWQTQIGEYPALIGVDTIEAPTIAAQKDSIYNPEQSTTIGTAHNATGVIDTSDIAIRVVNTTNRNSTVVAVNSTVSSTGDVNTTIPAGEISGDVTLEAQLYNNSTETVTAAAPINLTSSSFVEVAVSDLAGSGTEANPYEITNASELQAMEDDLDASYILDTDIDASETANWNDDDGFNPVGSSPYATTFTGSFDGNGNTISGLTIDRPSEDYVGLFGAIESQGEITDVNLTEVTVEGTDEVGGLVGNNIGGSVIDVSVDGTVIGNDKVGGLAGENDAGSITNASADSTINGTDETGGLVGNNDGLIVFVSARGTVDGTEEVGGLIGENGGTVRIASASGTVNGTKEIGGLVGENDEIVRGASANGTVNGTDRVGGLVGRNDDLILDTFTIGTVNGRTDVGGLVGYAPISSTVNDSYWDTEATGRSDAIGQDEGDREVTGLTTTQMTGGAARTNMTDLEFGTVWRTQPDDYPTHAAESVSSFDIDVTALSGSGTKSDPYEITNASELQAMEDDLTANYTLESDIDATETSQFNYGLGFNPINAESNNHFTSSGFSGSFNGSGYSISELTINRPTEDDVGLFGFVESQGTVGNITLINSTIEGTDQVGSLVGHNDGSVTNISVDGTVNGDSFVGGLIGNNDGPITDVSVDGTVNGTGGVGGLIGRNGGSVTEVSTDGTVNGAEGVGGLVGFNDGSITDVLTNNTINGNRGVGGLAGDNMGSLRSSFTTGTVNGGGYVGGVVGRMSSHNSEISNSYWDINATGQDKPVGNVPSSSQPGGVTGLNTTQMTGEAALTNMTLPFGTVWKIQPNGYPERIESPSPFDIDVTALSGNGTTNDPYVITNASELQAMEDDLTANYTLESDIDATETSQFNHGLGFDPIGANNGFPRSEFNGTFDGNGNTIFGLSINWPTTEYVGLFGAVMNQGEITNVSLRNVDIEGGDSVGGLVGFNRGSISNVSVDGTVTGDRAVGGVVGSNLESSIVDASTESTVTGDREVGGLIGGSFESSITSVSADGTVTGSRAVGGLIGSNGRGSSITNASTESTVSGNTIVGGLAGFNNGLIIDASEDGTTNGNTIVGGLVGTNWNVIKNTLATGTVNGTTDVGGLVGNYEAGSINDSYWDIEATGQSDSAGNATGLITAEMTGEAAQTNMNLSFGTVWQTRPDEYPTLVALPSDDSEGDDDTDGGGDNDDTESTGSIGGPIGGGQPTTEAEQPESTAPTVDQVRDELEQIEPTTETSTEITTAGSEGDGITVSTDGAASVDEIRFDSEDVSGTVEVTEYTEPPESVSESISAAVSESVREDVAQDVEDEASSDVAEATDGTDGETTTAADGDNSDQSTESDRTTSVTVAAVADISPTSDSARNSPATVTMTVDRDKLDDDPSDTFIVHEQGNSWDRLETTVDETSEEEVTLEAQTDSFSLFAVAEVQHESPSESDTQPATESQPTTDDGTDSDSSPPIVRLVGVLVVAAVVGVAIYARSN